MKEKEPEVPNNKGDSTAPDEDVVTPAVSAPVLIEREVLNTDADLFKTEERIQRSDVLQNRWKLAPPNSQRCTCPRCGK